MQILHKSHSLKSVQKQLIDSIIQQAKIHKNDFSKLESNVREITRGFNSLIKEETQLGYKSEFDFTLSIFPEDKQINVAESLNGEDFFILSSRLIW